MSETETRRIGREILEALDLVRDRLAGFMEGLPEQPLPHDEPEPVTVEGTGPLCALVVGHRPSDPGAWSSHAPRTSEYAWNGSIAEEVLRAVRAARVTIIHREDREDGYARLPGRINALSPDFVVSLHFNAYADPSANGTETLYLSEAGRKLAAIAQAEMLEALGLRDRGLKRVTSSEQRGWTLLSGTKAPTIICEPGFGTHAGDWARMQSRRDRLVTAYARAIERMARMVEEG